MDCIPYIEDLYTEIKILKDIKNQSNFVEIDKKILEKEELINKCKNNISNLSNNQICYRLYLHILNGLSISRAVEKVAEENYMNNIKPATERAIYQKYYSELKEILKKSQTSVKFQ